MEQIKTSLAQVISLLFGISDINIELSPVPENQTGDYASNISLQLAKKLSNNPREIAEMIKTALADADFEVEIASPGFLNFILPDEYFRQNIAEMARDFEKNISQNEYFGKKVVCEFSDPNPFKVLHVGHLYTSMVGDSIARLIECAGGKVIRANFGGDVGLHVAKTIYALLKNDPGIASIESAAPTKPTSIASEPTKITPELLATSYVDGTRAYDDDESARQTITKLNTLLYEISKKGPDFDWQATTAQDVNIPSTIQNVADQCGTTPHVARTLPATFSADRVAKAYWAGREASYAYFEEFYAKIGVKFDKYYPESTVAGRGLVEVKHGLEQGIYEESDGAVVFPGEKYGLHTRVFINQAGLPTYEAKDVGLLFTKWDDYHFDESIVITGNDIIEYMKVVLKSVELMQPKLSKRTKHLAHGNVRLPGNEKMSSRKGNFIKAVDVLDSVKALVPDEIIAFGAIRYAFLKYRIGGNIEFDAKESVSTTGNSGVYLQYSAVRAKKMLAKCQKVANSTSVEQPSPTNQPASLASQSSSASLFPEERALMKKISEYPVTLKNAIHELAPHKIANYLYETAQVFSKFYENVKVAGSPREQELAKLVTIYLKTMEHGLNLLGIEVPDEM